VPGREAFPVIISWTITKRRHSGWLEQAKRIAHVGKLNNRITDRDELFETLIDHCAKQVEGIATPEALSADMLAQLKDSHYAKES